MKRIIDTELTITRDYHGMLNDHEENAFGTPSQFQKQKLQSK